MGIKMRYYLAIFCVAFTSIIFGQSPNISDTLNVVTLQKFSVPENKSIVLTNIRDISFTAELLNSNFEKIRECTEFKQDPPPSEFPVAGKRGKMVQYSVYETIDEPGTYYVKISIKYRDEEVSSSLSAYYQINVDHPTIASKVNLRNKYYFSEKETFSFNTAEYSNQMNYSYSIKDDAGSEIENGNGPIVNLDAVFNDERNVGRKFIISGMYNGKEFSYKDPVSGEVKKAEWEFTLEKPELDEFVAWQKKDELEELLLSIYNKKAMSFLYLYVGKTPSGFAVVAPKVRNLSVVSEPSDFMKSFNSTASGKFLFVNINVNEEFVERMEECGSEPVKLTLQFTTQFGEKILKEYYATVIK
jgi:hypothetical protein